MASSNNFTKTDVTRDLGPKLGLLSDAMYQVAMSVILSVDFTAGTYATAANIVNIMVFSRMGFSDSINVSLTALAVSDLGIALTTIVCVVGFLLPTIPSMPFTYEVFLAPAAYPHGLLSRISAMITAYISIERYLCVFWPLKIKRVITSKRTLIIMVVIFGATFAQLPIAFMRYPIGWKFDSRRNKTLLGIVPVNDAAVVFLNEIYLIMVSVIVPFVTFFLVVFCSVLLAISLRRSQSWRNANRATSNITEHTEGGPKPGKDQSKEAKAVKMVITVATVFIITNIPSCVQIIAVMTIPEFSITGPYSYMYNVTGMAFFGVNSINSGANLVIYYRMSNKFRQSLLKMCTHKQASKN